MNELAAYAPWFAVAISLIALVRNELRGQSKDTAEKFRDVELRIGTVMAKADLVEDKVNAVQNDLKHLPDKEITHRLEMSIGELRTEMRGLNERMKPIGAMADRVQEAILEKVMS